jgi:hypothetical protein
MQTPSSVGPVAFDNDGHCILDLAPPPQGCRRVSDVAWLVEDDGVRTVWVRGVVVAQHDLSDTLGRNVAIWLLASAKYAKQTEIALAFALTARQVNRLCREAAREGAGALVRKERSDRTCEAVARRVCRLREQGDALASIARQVKLSTRTVYSILQERGYDPHDRPGPTQLDLDVSGDCDEQDDEPLETEGESLTDDLAQAPAETSGYAPDKPEADVEFEDASGVWGAGVLLAVAAEGGALLQEARGIYGQLRAGVYGLRAFVQGLFVMAWLGVRSPEGLKAKAPHGLGVLLGLPRIFEVKTLRRKLRETGARGKAGDWYREMAKRWVADADEEIATLYVDGHTRAYYGKRPIAKGWCARRRLCQPATTDTWTNDALGQPLLRITHEAHPTVAQVLPEVLADVRALVGPRRLTVAFDRGGWSGATFKKVVAEGFDFITYRPGHHDPLPADAFEDCPKRDGVKTKVRQLADMRLQVRAYGEARLIVILSDNGKQTHIVTSNRNALPLDLALQLLGRWRQENYFKYMRQNYSLDALVDYGTAPVEDREIPNPQYRDLSNQLRRARAQLRRLQAQAEAARTKGEAINNDRNLQLEISAQTQLIDELLRQRGTLAPRCMLSQTDRAGEVKLAVERKLCSDLVKMAAYRAECQMVRRIEATFARNADEGHAFVRAVMQQTGTIAVQDRDVYITLEPMSAPRFTRALEALCAATNSDNPVYPETDWRLHFHVRQDEDRHPASPACQEF